MMMNTSTKTQPRGKGHRPFPGAVALAALAAVSLAACDFDRVLDVPDPDVVLPDLTRSETALPSWRAATLGDFAVAYSGNGGSEGQILTSGLLADEFYHSGTFPTRREIDERNIRIENATTQAVFRNLQRARNTAEEASTVYEEFGPDQAGRAEVLSLAGFTYVMFGENYCSGVPFSRFDLQTGEIEYGEPSTRMRCSSGPRISSAPRPASREQVATCSSWPPSGWGARSSTRVGSRKPPLPLQMWTRTSST
jgi:hypothetical protein